MLSDVLRTLGVPLEEIAVGAVNGSAIFSFDDVRVRDQDRVELYPPVGGGSAASRIGL
jgi:sulfur carrier protein ThiS